MTASPSAGVKSLRPSPLELLSEAEMLLQREEAEEIRVRPCPRLAVCGVCPRAQRTNRRVCEQIREMMLRVQRERDEFMSRVAAEKQDRIRYPSASPSVVGR
jgi:hypothetical protein